MEALIKSELDSVKPLRSMLARGAACDLCRSRKVKCDGVRPTCSQCLKSAKGVPDAVNCVYKGDAKSIKSEASADGSDAGAKRRMSESHEGSPSSSAGESASTGQSKRPRGTHPEPPSGGPRPDEDQHPLVPHSYYDYPAPYPGPRFHHHRGSFRGHHGGPPHHHHYGRSHHHHHPPPPPPFLHGPPSFGSPPPGPPPPYPPYYDMGYRGEPGYRVESGYRGDSSYRGDHGYRDHGYRDHGYRDHAYGAYRDSGYHGDAERPGSRGGFRGIESAVRGGPGFRGSFQHGDHSRRGAHGGEHHDPSGRRLARGGEHAPADSAWEEHRAEFPEPRDQPPGYPRARPAEYGSGPRPDSNPPQSERHAETSSHRENGHGNGRETAPTDWHSVREVKTEPSEQSSAAARPRSGAGSGPAMQGDLVSRGDGSCGNSTDPSRASMADASRTNTTDAPRGRNGVSSEQLQPQPPMQSAPHASSFSAQPRNIPQNAGVAAGGPVIAALGAPTPTPFIDLADLTRQTADPAVPHPLQYAASAIHCILARRDPTPHLHAIYHAFDAMHLHIAPLQRLAVPDTYALLPSGVAAAYVQLLQGDLSAFFFWTARVARLAQSVQHVLPSVARAVRVLDLVCAALTQTAPGLGGGPAASRPPGGGGEASTGTGTEAHSAESATGLAATSSALGLLCLVLQELYGAGAGPQLSPGGDTATSGPSPENTYHATLRAHLQASLRKLEQDTSHSDAALSLASLQTSPISHSPDLPDIHGRPHDLETHLVCHAALLLLSDQESHFDGTLAFKSALNIVDVYESVRGPDDFVALGPLLILSFYLSARALMRYEQEKKKAGETHAASYVAGPLQKAREFALRFHAESLFDYLHGQV